MCPACVSPGLIFAWYGSEMTIGSAPKTFSAIFASRPTTQPWR